MVTTRFAPSPTGNLHIGGCRTLLYNWLFAKKHNGKLILRIEDTDLKRSTDAALQNILEGIKWLGLNWDDEIAYQSANINRHREIALQLLENGKAYKCYCTEEELGEMREEAIKKKKSAFYNNKWRDREPNEKDKNINKKKHEIPPMFLNLNYQINQLYAKKNLFQYVMYFLK